MTSPPISHSKNFQLRLGQTMRQRLEQYTARTGFKMAEIFRIALTEYLDRQEATNSKVQALQAIGQRVAL